MATNGDFQQRFLAELGRPFLCEELFDAVADTVFFLKDHAGRYVAVNQTLVARCGVSAKSDLIGRRAEEVFPAPLGARISQQDARVVVEKRAIIGQLERHLYPGGVEGWCLTWKEPLVGKGGRIVGLSGISRDLQTPALTGADAATLSHLLDHIRNNLDKPMRLADLAARADLTVFQLDRRIRALFGLSAGQFVTRARIDLACNRLRQSARPIVDVAFDCGYAGQAAFTRQFRKTVGLTPKAYRDQA
jgi:AraC-like DNA-binding protein